LSELFKLVYNLYLAVNIVKMIKLRRIELEHVRCMVETEPQLKFGVENSGGRDDFGDLDLDGRVVLK
jgi:hypothetical protein